MDINKKLGERIKEKRLELNLTQQSLATKTKTTYQTIINAEHGRKITVSTLTKICDALGLKIELTN